MDKYIRITADSQNACLACKYAQCKYTVQTKLCTHIIIWTVTEWKRLMSIAGKKRGLAGCSWDILHKAKGDHIYQVTRIRWFPRWLGWSLLARPRGSKLLKEGHQAWVNSDQMVLVMAKREAGPVSWWPLKGYTLSSFSQGGLSGLSLLRSDGSRDSQTGGGISCPVAKDTQMRVGKQL